jgi:transcriptional regulator with XRE-family HTH domain
MDDSSQSAELTSALTAFPALLRQLRLQARLSQNRLAHLSGIDPAYVNRMEAATESSPVVPRPSVLARLAVALGLSPAQRDRLYFAAGRCPPTLAAVGRWDPALGLVAALLGDERLGEDDLAEFRQVLVLLVDRWRRSSGSAARREDQQGR